MGSRARSFRDPAGRLHFLGAEPIRQVYAGYAQEVRALVNGDLLRGLMEAGEVVATRTIDATPGELAAIVSPADLLLAHEAIPFPSFPAEWPAEMLHAAAALTLEIAERALEDGMGIKDATPYNVLFKGGRPVFVDVLSFEHREPRDPVWLAQGQFIRTFLLPLLAAGDLKLPPSALFLPRRDGIEPAQLYGMLSPLKRIRPRYLGAVSLPVWLSGRAEAAGSAMYRPRSLKSEAQARFVLKAQFRALRNKIDGALKLSTSRRTSWSDYCRTCTYGDDAFAGKSSLVAAFLERARPAKVLDVGCNTGHFSRLAAARGSEVVAIDQDAAVIGALYGEARQEKLDILPLLVDFARPTPSTGWNNEETPSFLARASGRFEAVLMLAVLHHLLVTDQIPLGEVMALAARLTNRHLVIEYVAPEDPQFKRLARGRDALYRHLTRECFEATAGQYFRIESRTKIEHQERWLYVMERSTIR